VPDFDGPAILAVLAKHKVEFITIGGFAAVVHGSPIPTGDVDIVPAGERENFARLSAGLAELDANIRVLGRKPLPFGHDADSLATSQILNLTTRYGDLDITQTPAGTRGYDDLRREAVTVRIRGTRVQLASLADVVRSKEACGRDKDRRSLPVLRELVARELREKAGRPARR
jgi:hypothetical protein